MSPESLRAAANALRYWELRQEAAANNLANAETAGFKGERVFAQLLDETVRGGARTDFGQGALRPTNGPLDVALEGEGFFVVATPVGERLTRGGSFALDAEGRLVDGAGHIVLGDEGEIRVPPGAAITIARDGSVHGDGRLLDRLRVETVADLESLQHEAAGRFVATGERVSVEAGARGVRQGMLEDSNVSTLDGMVELITIQRAYASVQGSLRTLDGVLDTIANRIGRVG